MCLHGLQSPELSFPALLGPCSSGWRPAESFSPSSDNVELAERSSGGRLEDVKRSKGQAYLDCSIIHEHSHFDTRSRMTHPGSEPVIIKDRCVALILALLSGGAEVYNILSTVFMDLEGRINAVHKTSLPGSTCRIVLTLSRKLFARFSSPFAALTLNKFVAPPVLAPIAIPGPGGAGAFLWATADGF